MTMKESELCCPPDFCHALLGTLHKVDGSEFTLVKSSAEIVETKIFCWNPIPQIIRSTSYLRGHLPDANTSSCKEQDTVSSV